MAIHSIEPDLFRFINQSINYIAGTNEFATERGESLDPISVGFRPDLTVTLTTSGYNRILNLQAPFLQEFVWTIPRNAKKMEKS